MPDEAESPPARLVVFTIDGQRYGLPLPRVERVLPNLALSPLPKAPDVVLGAFNLHGKILPVLDIRRRFHLPRRDYAVTSHLVIARMARRVVALPADEALGVMEVSAQAIEPPGSVVPGIGHVAGIVALPDGLLIIQDLDAFFSLDEERRLAEALEGAPG